MVSGDAATATAVDLSGSPARTTLGTAPGRNSSVPSQDRYLLIALAIYTVAAFLVISRPVTCFPHYANFLLFPVACLAGITVANTAPRNRRLWLVFPRC